MATYLPEGYQTQYDMPVSFHSMADAHEALSSHRILEARAVVCDAAHNLIVDLGCMKGIIPREECAIGIKEGTTRDIAILSKVNKPVCFRVTAVRADEKFKPYAVLSRREVQEECRRLYIDKLRPGDIIRGRITHMESFGCFVDIGCGVISLLPIDAISVSRISHPRDRFTVGQNILAAVKAVGEDGRISLSHKELLGTWSENAGAVFRRRNCRRHCALCGKLWHLRRACAESCRACGAQGRRACRTAGKRLYQKPDSGADEGKADRRGCV